MSVLAMRPELEPLPAHMNDLPIDARGYPVPWFVEWIEGAPEFRMMNRRKWVTAITCSVCWVCGHHVGVRKTFAIGPMCGVNRTTTEPGCHHECAEWSARNCPFLSRPQARRREDELTERCRGNSAGAPILRNPGVALLWTAKHWRVFDDGRGRPLIRLGDPIAVAWYCEGRPATRAEVQASIDGGLPALREMAEAQDREEGGTGATRALDRAVAALAPYLPHA